MFVKDNSIQAVKAYFNKALKEHFSERELKIITQRFICKRLNWSNSDYLMSKEVTVSESDLLFFRAAVKRLLEGEPFHHVIGDTYFYNISILTTPQALIPRPETEELVDWILMDLPEKPQRIIDIGTGTGCIPLAIKKERKKDEVYGIDISNDAIKLAQENAQFLALDVRFIVYDILVNDANRNINKSWDVIISNPPYIPEKERAYMASHVLKYEPEGALFVPNDQPLLFYERIAIFAKEHLTQSGKLFFEIHEDLGPETIHLLENYGFDTEMKKDLQGKDRMIKATFKS